MAGWTINTKDSEGGMTPKEQEQLNEAIAQIREKEKQPLRVWQRLVNWLVGKLLGNPFK
jgi:hypothetical protein